LATKDEAAAEYLLAETARSAQSLGKRIGDKIGLIFVLREALPDGFQFCTIRHAVNPRGFARECPVST
jgi:hypothetical protein